MYIYIYIYMKKSDNNIFSNKNIFNTMFYDRKYRYRRYNSKFRMSTLGRFINFIFVISFFTMIIHLCIRYIKLKTKKIWSSKIPFLSDILLEQNWGWGLIKIFICLVIIYLITHIIYYNVTYFEKKITIKKKYQRFQEESYMVVDNNNNIYNIDNLWWKFDFNKAEDWNLLKKNETYIVKGYGMRVGMLNYYPYINTVEPVKPKK